MVNRIILAAVLALGSSVAVFAQSDDYPRIEISMGYGNLGLPTTTAAGATTTERHSGFTSTQSLNLTRWLGIENYTGYYSVGSGTQLIQNVFGGKLTSRQMSSGRVVPYLVAGFGAGYFTDGYYGGSVSNARLGGGIDVYFSDTMGFKVDVSRMSFHSGGWQSGTNISTGIIFRMQ